MTQDEAVEQAIAATREEDYLRGLTAFIELYGTGEALSVKTPRDAAGLSYFGLCMALVQKDFRTAINLCRWAIDREFYNGNHYANLTRVYLAQGNRKKAVSTAEEGLKADPENEELLEVRKIIGIRARPAVPFLDRSNPINVTIGQVRAAKQLEEEAPVEMKAPPKKSQAEPRRRRRTS